MELIWASPGTQFQVGVGETRWQSLSSGSFFSTLGGAITASHCTVFFVSVATANSQQSTNDMLFCHLLLSTYLLKYYHSLEEE